MLCILAVIPTIIAGSMEASDYYCGLSVGLLLFILAIGVNLLVRVGMVKSSYDTPVSYTHLDVYKRQVVKHQYTPENVSVFFLNSFSSFVYSPS